MRCSGCGSTIPFGGEVCPHCQRDKSSDQAATVATGVGVIVGGFIGNLVAGFGGMIVGGFVLGTIAAIIAMSGRNHSAQKPPRVRVEPSAPVERSKPRSVPAPFAADGGSVEDRLRRLDRLKADGLITEDEHQTQRKTIIVAL